MESKKASNELSRLSDELEFGDGLSDGLALLNKSKVLMFDQNFMTEMGCESSLAGGLSKGDQDACLEVTKRLSGRWQDLIRT